MFLFFLSFAVFCWCGTFGSSSAGSWAFVFVSQFPVFLVRVLEGAPVLSSFS
jgi:hypothetical protein